MLLSGKLLCKQIRLALSFYLCDSLNYRGALLPSKTNKTPEWDFLSLCTITTWGQVILEWGCPICVGYLPASPASTHWMPSGHIPKSCDSIYRHFEIFPERQITPWLRTTALNVFSGNDCKLLMGKKKKNYNWCSLIPSFHGLWRLFPNLSKWKPCFIHRQTNLIQFCFLSTSHWMG